MARSSWLSCEAVFARNRFDPEKMSSGKSAQKTQVRSSRISMESAACTRPVQPFARSCQALDLPTVSPAPITYTFCNLDLPQLAAYSHGNAESAFFGPQRASNHEYNPIRNAGLRLL